MKVVSEPGVYRLIFRSRKPEAERFKRWIAHEVLPAIRKTGQYGAPKAGPMPEATLMDAPLAAKVGMLHFVMRTRGKEAAVAYMKYLGLPEIPAQLGHEKRTEAAALLDLILEHRIDGQPVRQLIANALEGEHLARQALASFGVLVSSDPEGFWLGSSVVGVKALMGERAGWIDAIRKLPGVVGAPRQSFGGIQSRTTWFPLSILDG